MRGREGFEPTLKRPELDLNHASSGTLSDPPFEEMASRILLEPLLPLFLGSLSFAQAGQEPGAGGSGPQPALQEETPELPLTVVTPGRRPQEAFEAPRSVQVVSEQQIEERSYRTTPEALRDLPGVMVQETAHGHGSPYIRGLTSFRNLFLIDGVRLNNSVFRPGPNQYWNTVDPESISSIEVVKGPSSVLYGSDAIGGTVNVLTRTPDVSQGWGGAVSLRAHSAEHSIVGRTEVHGNFGADSAFLLGITRKDFGDVEGGRDTGEQPYTGYEEWAGDAKFVHTLSDTQELIVAHQRVDQNDVPRTHRTVYAVPFEGTSIGSDLRREFDQDRALTYAKLATEGVDTWFDHNVTTISLHEQDELRDRVRSNGRRELQGFDVTTVGLASTFERDWAPGILTYGLEAYRDSVDSFLNKFDQQTAADDIQGAVADDATYDLFGIFAEQELSPAQDWSLTLGARLTHAGVDAESVRDPLTDTQTSVEDDWQQLTGSIRVAHDLDPERLKLFGGISQGFRAPNLSDLTRYDSARSNEFEIPSTDLQPEDYLSYEVGLRSRTGSSAGEVALFYTDISDQISRFPTGNVNSEGESEVTKANVGDGYIYGIELSASHYLSDEWTAFGNATWMNGRVDAYPDSSTTVERDTITRLMPPTLELGVRWQRPESSLWVEGRTTLVDAQDKLSASDERDTSRIPPGGTPGYATLDLFGGHDLTEDIELVLGLENITDEDYRIHGSGLNRPGFGVVFGIRMSF